MKEEIENAFNSAEVDLIRGSGGNFIVEVNEEVIFSKNELRPSRFPEDGEILLLIENSKLS
ncbi:MAG: hypothetical protein GXZ15_03155 [Campylobacter sp.]|nr:hypothetical protein [Campylobacter sp.]